MSSEVKRYSVRGQFDHGLNLMTTQKIVLAYREGEGTYRVYFLEGAVISQQVPANALSKSWVYPTSKKGVKA